MGNLCAILSVFKGFLLQTDRCSLSLPSCLRCCRSTCGGAAPAEIFDFRSDGRHEAPRPCSPPEMVCSLLHKLTWGLENPEESPVGHPWARQHHTSRAGDVYRVSTFTGSCVKGRPGDTWPRGLWVALGSAPPLIARAASMTWHCANSVLGHPPPSTESQPQPAAGRPHVDSPGFGCSCCEPAWKADVEAGRVRATM